MRHTLLENKLLHYKKPLTEELEFEEEITSIHSIPSIESQFIMENKDVLLINIIAEKENISYNSAMKLVLRDALDLYHWYNGRSIK